VVDVVHLMPRHPGGQGEQVAQGGEEDLVLELPVLKPGQGPARKGDAQLLLGLVPARFPQVVPLGIGKEGVEVGHRLVPLGRVAGPEEGEELEEGLLRPHGEDALVQKPLDQVPVGPEFPHQGLLVVAQDPEEEDQGEFPLVHLDRDHPGGFELEVNPGSPLGQRDDAGHEPVRAQGVWGEVDPGGAVDLADDDPVRPVDDEGAVLRHQGEVAQEDLVLFDEAGVLVDELEAGVQGGLVGQVLLPALLHWEKGLPQAVLEEVQNQAATALLPPPRWERSPETPPGCRYSRVFQGGCPAGAPA